MGFKSIAIFFPKRRQQTEISPMKKGSLPMKTTF